MDQQPSSDSPPPGSDPEQVVVKVETPPATQQPSLEKDTQLPALKVVLESSKVVVLGKSACPFCVEVSRTLSDLNVPFKYYKLDSYENGHQLWDELKKTTGQKTVPYVFMHGLLLGGCDATKALIASGGFEKRLGNVGGAMPMATGEDHLAIRLAGVDEDAPHIVGALFNFPNAVDNRIIRLVGFQVFVVSLLIAIFSNWKYIEWRWISVGLLGDFGLRVFGGAGISPFGGVAMLTTAIMDLILPMVGIESGPQWGAGPPKQFAAMVGVFFCVCIVFFQFYRLWILSTIFSAVLCFFAALESFLGFCAGCLVFSFMIKFKLVPDTVYYVYINTLPEIKYAWHEWTKRVHPAEPQAVVQRFAAFLRPGQKKTRIDLHYKTGKTDDWERETFHPIKHAKIGFFSSAVAVVAIPAMFRFMSMVPTMGTPDLVWQILTLISFVYTTIITLPYLLKMVLYPRKVAKEWMHPTHQNAFTVPFMMFMIYAFLAIHYSRPLARVLYWAGAGPLLLLAVALIGDWLAAMRHEGAVNGAMQITPVGLFIAAIMGPIVDPSYRHVAFLWFGFGVVMYMVLFVMTFQKNVAGYIADPRGRVFAGIWVAAPATFCIAWTVLTDPSWKMDYIAQGLFYVSFSMGLLLLWMVGRRFIWLQQFAMQAWALAFPSIALGWAAILYDYTIDTALSKVLAVCMIVTGCTVTTVLALRTFAGIFRLKVFIPEHKWGPMSHLPLAQEAMRNLLQQLETGVADLAADPGNGRLAERVLHLYRSFECINKLYIRLKNKVCYPQVGQFFPRHQDHYVAQNERMLQLMEQVERLLPGKPKAEEQGCTDGVCAYVPGQKKKKAAEDPNAPPDYAPLLAQVQSCAQYCRQAFDEMEDHIRPVMRRYVAFPVQRKIINDCWDEAARAPEELFQAIPLVIMSLPMLQQRLTYLRAWLWAMPERCQQLGTMVALGVDPVNWYLIKQAMPEVIPRGESGWRTY